MFVAGANEDDKFHISLNSGEDIDNFGEYEDTKLAMFSQDNTQSMLMM